MQPKELQQELNKGILKVVTQSAGDFLLGLKLTLSNGKTIYIRSNEDQNGEVGVIFVRGSLVSEFI